MPDSFQVKQTWKRWIGEFFQDRLLCRDGNASLPVIFSGVGLISRGGMNPEGVSVDSVAWLRLFSRQRKFQRLFELLRLRYLRRG
jgi:hypothetical protein